MPKTPRTSGRSALPTLAALALFLLAPAPLMAQFEYEWGRALMEDFRLEDLAEDVFTKMSNGSNTERKNEGLLGLSSLRRRQAQRADDVAQRTELNDKSLELLEQVSKNLNPTSNRYWDAQFELADTLEAVAKEDIDLITQGRVPSDKLDDYRKRNQNRLDRATFIYLKAATEFGGVDPDVDSEKWALGQKARLMAIVLKLRRAELAGTDPKMLKAPSRVNELVEMVDQLGDYALDNDGLLFGMWGYYYRARAQEALQECSDRVSLQAVIDGYKAVPQLMIVTPSRYVPTEDYPEWEPLPPAGQFLAQQTYLSLLELLNRKGMTGKAIEEGEQFRATWKECGYRYNVFGSLALIELAQAYQNAGRSAEALEIAAAISDEGGYQGQQADKLMSLIIRTAVNRDQFDPQILAAGANGAYVAGRKNDEKYLEAVELYRGVLENLDKIQDATARNDLGRLASYRMGIVLDRLGRKLESAAALENGYRRFNNEQVREDPKLNETISRYWLAVLREFRDETGNADYARDMLSNAESYVIANPPQGGVGGTVLTLTWRQAENFRRQKNWEEAKKLYRQLAADPSEYQEQAMVKLAVVEYEIVDDEKDVGADRWLQVVKGLEDYKDYANAHEETDPTRLDRRRQALLEADLRITGALMNAISATESEEAKKPLYSKIVTTSEGFDSRTTDDDAARYVRFNRLQALVGLGDLEEAEKVFAKLVENKPDDTRYLPSAGLILGGALRDYAGTIPTTTKDGIERRNEVMLRAGEAYRTWLLAKMPSKSGYYSLVYGIFYDLERWDEAYDILKVAYDKFADKRGQEKTVAIFRRRMARCLLEKAKAAYLENENDPRVQTLFDEAALIYRELLGEDKKGPLSVMEEAAEIFGGFLVGPDRRGFFRHYPGAGEFADAQEIWSTVERLYRKKTGDDFEEQAQIERSRQKARFYIFLLEYRLAEAEKDSDPRRRQRLLANLRSKELKEGGDPGGPEWSPKYKWLIQQVSLIR